MKDDGRFQDLIRFVATTDWRDSDLTFLAGDASNRRYWRVTSTKLGSAVVMDAPPEKGEDVGPFVQITEHLLGMGLSAPRLFDADAKNGFLLIEDLGDALYARRIESDPTCEAELYAAAIDVLSEIALSRSLPKIPSYDIQTMSGLSGLAATWYAGERSTAAEIETIIAKNLSKLTDRPDSLVLRDFHAENLIWLPERSGTARVGLLDYQDARIGFRAYDLASLIRDARRDVSPETKSAVTDQFSRALGQSREETEFAVSILGAQRNLRILGVFARLSLHFGKPHYIDLIPRVWRNLLEELDHGELLELKRAIVGILPSPTEEILKDLKSRCGTVPALA